jgi:osmotically-inducible protein OsmY
MKAVVGSLFVLATLVAVPTLTDAAGPAQATATSSADRKLGDRIATRLNASSLKSYNIDVSVDGGVAKLSGKVATDADRLKAEQLAKIQGVARVDDQLVVDPSLPKSTMETVKEKTKAGAEKTKEGAEVVADKTKEGLSKSGEVITDAWITTRVHTKFVDEDLLKGSDITVDTKDHVVTLRGTVMSAAGRARAVEQAKEVEGVHRVVDRLAIGPKK